MKLTPEEKALLKQLLAKKSAKTMTEVKLSDDVVGGIQKKLGVMGRCVLTLGANNKVSVWGYENYRAKTEHGKRLGSGEMGAAREVANV